MHLLTTNEMKSIEHSEHGKGVADLNKTEFVKVIRMNLVNNVLLSSKIEHSPYKVSMIADMIGVSYDTLNRRLNGGGKFHLFEVVGLIMVLKMTPQEIYEIFFAPYLRVLEERGIYAA